MPLPGHPTPISGLQQAGVVSGSNGMGKQAPFKAVWGSKDHPISGSVGAKTCSGPLCRQWFIA